MTNVEALTKLAKAIGIAAPVQPSDINIVFTGDIEGREILELKANNEVIKTLYKVSDLTPTAEDLIGGYYMSPIADTVKYPFESIPGDPIANGAIYNDPADPNWIVVHNTNFSMQAGIPGTQTAPSTGIYLVSSSALFVGAPSEGSMGETIAEVLDYIAENYPSA